MKTISLKKVSAVAVASLGFGLMSVVPAQAVETASGLITAVNLKSATANTLATGATQQIFFGATKSATAFTAATESSFVAALTAFPSGGFVAVSAVTNSGLLSFTDAANTDTVVVGPRVEIEHVAVGVAAVSTVTATGTDGLSRFDFTPTVAGTYSVTVWNDQDLDGVIDATEARQSLDLVIAAAAGLSTALSSVNSAQDTADAGVLPTATTSAAGISSALTSGALAGRILVTTRKTTNALAPGHTITAIVTGSGFVTAGNTANDAPSAAQVKAATTTTASTRTASVASTANTNGQVVVAIWGDGTGGTGTVTIQVTDSVTGATTTIGTVKTSFFGTVTTLKATVLQANATAGATNGCANVATCTQATLALTPAVVLEARDTNGILVPGLTVTGKSADTAVVAATTVAIVDGTGTDKNGLGFYNASVTGGAAANVGKSTTIVYSTIVSATVTISATAVTIFNMGTPATVTWSLDKTTYTPGSPVSLVVTAKDAAGNAAADGTYATLFAGASVLGGSITGSTPAASVEILGGKATFAAFAPGTAGTYTVSNKFGASMPSALQGTAISTSIVVSDPNAAILTQIDALNAKIVALNALIAKIMKKLGVK